MAGTPAVGKGVGVCHTIAVRDSDLYMTQTGPYYVIQIGSMSSTQIGPRYL